jgi:anthranilate synthase component 1
LTDPWTEFLRESEGAPVAGYFERGDAPGTPGRWAVSFTDPVDRFEVTADTDTASLDRRTSRLLRGDPSRAIVGYVGFDAVSAWEPLLAHYPRGAPFPLGEMAVVHQLKRRRVPRTTRATVRGESPPHRAPRALDETLGPAQFRRAVARLRRAIGEGEAFQVVVASRRTFARPQDLLDRATRLRARERYAYFYYLRFDDREIVGASPESVLEVERGRAFVSPIAGTRPRGRAGARRRPLHLDAKELAEHRMLVDLARNDLGRVSVGGSVRILWRERREAFARLEHLVSRVVGTLRRDVGPWSVLAATFPAGTVSGAPKIRATELLRAEERTWRGPYGGAVGLVTGDGRSAWALAIRSAFIVRNRLYTEAGAGIVWGSEPAREFREMRAKLAQVESSLVEGPA